MTKKVRIIFLVAALIITSCSDSINPVNTTETKVNLSANFSKTPTFLSAKDFNDLEKEYSAFTTKSASQGYVKKKLDIWLDTANNGASIKGPQLLREVEFARIKGETEIPLKALFASVAPALLYNKVANATAITTAINSGNVPLDIFINYTVNPISQVQDSLTADTITSAGFTARWGTVAGATAYEIMVNNTTTFSTTNTFYPVSITGTGHTFKVRAIKNSVPGAYSSDFSVPAIPAVPAILTTDNLTSSSFRANWSSVTGATGYEIKIGANTFSAGTNTFYNATGLTGTSHSFQVRAIKDSATGDYSNPPTSVTLPAPNLLLDTNPNAALAFSLRKVRSPYSGNAVRVRRSSDNAQQDIGFVNNILDTAALQSFVGSGDGYITTWYDQSGNARNATQSLTTQQPVLVSSGTVLTNLGKPSIKFVAGSLQNLVNSSFNLAQPNSAFVVAHYAGTTGQNYIFDSANSTDGRRNAILRNQSSAVWDFYAGIELFGPATVTGNYLVEGYFKTTSSRLYLNNNTAVSGNPGSWSMEGITIGHFSGVKDQIYTWGSFINELIIYNSDQQSNRAGITTNINSHYSIY